MKNVFIGVIIALVVFLIVDFIYTEQNTCDVGKNMSVVDIQKCGILKKELDIEINVFGRYW